MARAGSLREVKSGAGVRPTLWIVHSSIMRCSAATAARWKHEPSTSQLAVIKLIDFKKLVQLPEKPFSAKLNMLYRSSMYPVALNLAKTQGLEDLSESVADIHKQYGDNLYNKGNWDGAMGQFVKTIGWVVPSYVIRMFLDAQQIHNLIMYLQELHYLGLANSDHTTLLLNAYTNQDQVAPSITTPLGIVQVLARNNVIYPQDILSAGYIPTAWFILYIIYPRYALSYGTTPILDYIPNA
ncbi:hypothetical protein DFH09DRAFT_1067082 [Mycena vulgaris]|nr:hypothetical protein DFH09DRAFT_1067082 [Mycena vulgaris]